MPNNGVVDVGALLPPHRSAVREVELVQPVLESQARHLREVARVAREQGGVVSERDTGNFEIHRSAAYAVFAELNKTACAILIPRQQSKACKKVDALD